MIRVKAAPWQWRRPRFREAFRLSHPGQRLPTLAEMEGAATAGARVSRFAVGLVVAGGAIWVLAGVLYSAQVVSCFSCGSVVVAPGVGTAGYPLAAIHSLAWDDLYANLYVATVGLLAIAVGLTGFRKGERWAWWATAVFVLAGLLTGLLDYLSWGGWYTVLFLGLLPLVGLALAARSFFFTEPREPH